jgi:O-methyltransferase
MASVRDLVRLSGKKAQWWLRQDRRMERFLHSFTRLESAATLYSHELIVPMNSTYSPWYDDSEFRAVYDSIVKNSFVDQYKCYELWEQLGQLTYVAGDILEVGVWRGGTGVLLARRASQLGIRARVYLADTFEGVAKASREDPWYRGGEHSDTSAAVVRELARRLGVEVELLRGIFPDDTGHCVADCLFRLVHIDVDVHDSAKQVLDWAWPRLCVGGTIVLDDYGSFECEGVATLGRDLMARSLPNARLVHNLNGHLLMVKLADGSLDHVRADVASLNRHVADR